MWKFLSTNELVKGAVIAALGYGLLALIVSPNTIIELLNGVFLGVLVMVVAIYWRMGWDALCGNEPYERSHRFAVGVALLWLSYAGFRTISVLIHSFEEWDWLRNSHFIGVFMMMAILAGIMQVTAPGLHSGREPPDDQEYIHGRDKPTLLAAMLLGLIVALIAYGFQRVG